MMRERVISWLLRLGAWACLAVPIGRIAFQPTCVALEGRAFQMHVRLEAERAADALFQHIGLARDFDPTVFYLVSAHEPGALPPMWLGLDRRANKGTLSWSRHIWLERDGHYLLPPLDNSPRAQGSMVTIPEHFYLPGKDGALLHGAWGMQFGGGSNGPECTVWVHRGDRWVNVLRVETASAGYPSAVPSPDRATALQLGNPLVAVFPWDATLEAFVVPPNLKPSIRVLDPLPDQRGSP